jgi:NDP-sugar pyrophosphorylase family protein
MQCVVLAGGLGTRLAAIANGKPKTLVEVAGRPFADHQLDWLARQGVTNVVYCIGFGGEHIREFVGDGSRWGLQVAYVDEGDDLLGTGGALRNAFNAGVLEPWTFVTYGDSLLTLDLAAVADAFTNAQQPALMTIFENHDAFDASNVCFENGRIVAYGKRPSAELQARMTYIDYGMLAFDRSLIAGIPENTVTDLADICARLSEAGELAAFVATERFYEIGTPEGLSATAARLAQIGGA